MTNSAYELLTLIFAVRAFQYSEFKLRPRDIRLDPKFSEALDNLIDSGYVTVKWNSDTVYVTGRREIGQECPTDPEILVVTESGLKFLSDNINNQFHRDDVFCT